MAAQPYETLRSLTRDATVMWRDNDPVKLIAILALTLVAGVGTAATGLGQPLSLRDLTAMQLPVGCILAPAPIEPEGGDRIRGGLWAGLPIDHNPWVGSDRGVTAAIRERVDRPSRLPDAPPVNPAQLAEYRRELANGIESSYAAVYRDSEVNAILVVYGLQFANEEDAANFRYNGRTTASETLLIGRIVAAISGPPSACFRAATAHIRSLD